jgi:hypothetical protein
LFKRRKLVLNGIDKIVQNLGITLLLSKALNNLFFDLKLLQTRYHLQLHSKNKFIAFDVFH